MMQLDVESLANTFKLSEGTPEQLDGELSVVEERFLVGVLGRRLLPLLYLERRFRKANYPEALCFEGMVRMMRRRNPDNGLKLIGDAAAEDSGAKYFLVMLKYCCSLADPEAMALLQEICGGPSPPDGRWKNHNLRWLRYLVKQDLDNIAWWY
jgi:hypothetical protein